MNYLNRVFVVQCAAPGPRCTAECTEKPIWFSNKLCPGPSSGVCSASRSQNHLKSGKIFTVSNVTGVWCWCRRLAGDHVISLVHASLIVRIKLLLTLTTLSCTLRTPCLVLSIKFSDIFNGLNPSNRYSSRLKVK